MSATPSAEINCLACGQESFVVRTPVYEGFRKVGETFRCAACGYVYSKEEDVPYKGKTAAQQLFTEADRPTQPTLFEEGENRIICRYCKHYVVNPFTQWCGVHQKEVEATDTCEQFADNEASPPPRRTITGDDYGLREEGNRRP